MAAWLVTMSVWSLLAACAALSAKLASKLLQRGLMEPEIKLYQSDTDIRIVNRSTIAAVYLLGISIFTLAQLAFTVFLAWPPYIALAVALLAGVARIGEIIGERTGRITEKNEIPVASISIISTLILAPVLALLTRQSDTHYFGLLILPILETSLYFSLRTTLSVAVICSGISMSWVARGAHFHLPFPPGEVLESSTLILIYFLIAFLVWSLLHMLRAREALALQQLRELETTRSALIRSERLGAVGKLASSIAHEIRNPVAIITSALEIAHSQEFRESERRDMEKIAALEAQRLQRLTTDFLSYARPPSMVFRDVDVSTLLGYVQSVSQVEALARGITVRTRIESPISASGDEGQLQQALLNLIKNAVEASPAGADVIVEARPLMDGTLVITVQNEGSEIPAEILEQIFEPFVTSKKSGSGLGLAIAKAIVDQHHGALTVPSNKNNEIVFAVRLPMSGSKPATL